MLGLGLGWCWIVGRNWPIKPKKGILSFYLIMPQGVGEDKWVSGQPFLGSWYSCQFQHHFIRVKGKSAYSLLTSEVTLPIQIYKMHKSHHIVHNCFSYGLSYKSFLYENCMGPYNLEL